MIRKSNLFLHSPLTVTNTL